MAAAGEARVPRPQVLAVRGLSAQARVRPPWVRLAESLVSQPPSPPVSAQVLQMALLPELGPQQQAQLSVSRQRAPKPSERALQPPLQEPQPLWPQAVSGAQSSQRLEQQPSAQAQEAPALGTAWPPPRRSASPALAPFHLNWGCLSSLR
jgi:hypothetical protein